MAAAVTYGLVSPGCKTSHCQPLEPVETLEGLQYRTTLEWLKSIAQSGVTWPYAVTEGDYWITATG